MTLISLEGVAGWIAVVMPLAAMLTAMLLAGRRRRRPASAAPKSTGRYGEHLPEKREVRRDAAAAANGNGAGSELAGASATPQSPLTPQSPATPQFPATPQSPVTPKSLPKKEPQGGWFPKVVGRANRRYAARTEPKFPSEWKARSPETLTKDIERAERSGEQAKLPSLFIALASHKLAGGDVVEASDLLRNSIRLSVSLGRHEEHARARLELGDIARTAGDLTTACEHWQIARRLFHQLAHAEQLAAAESRMSDHGCPTDWVLNDF